MRWQCQRSNLPPGQAGENYHPNSGNTIDYVWGVSDPWGFNTSLPPFNGVFYPVSYTRIAEITDGTVSIAAMRERDHVRLTVSDTGPGIPLERRARIFERFRRGTSEGDGAGLGLAIGNAIVEATKGRWQIADVPGGGTSVGVVWPLSRTRLVDRVQA